MCRFPSPIGRLALITFMVISSFQTLAVPDTLNSSTALHLTAQRRIPPVFALVPATLLPTLPADTTLDSGAGAGAIQISLIPTLIC